MKPTKSSQFEVQTVDQLVCLDMMFFHYAAKIYKFTWKPPKCGPRQKETHLFNPGSRIVFFPRTATRKKKYFISAEWARFY